MSKYKVIFLDIDDTIFDFIECEKSAIKKTMLKYNITPTEELIREYSEINKGFWLKFERKQITKPELLRQRFETFFVPLGVTENPDEINKTYLNYLSEDVYFVEGAQDFLEKLHQEFKIYILTNGVTLTQKRRLNMSGILPLIDEVFISEEVGFQKPDTRFYEYVHQRIGSPDINTIIMLGDSKTSDIQGGINFGIDTCWFNIRNKDNHPQIIPTYEIKSLSEFFKKIS